jgi:hypothetical protein
MKKLKYNNKKTEKYGRKWDSLMELSFYEHLLKLKEAGEVLEIELQPVFLLQDKYKYKDKTVRAITYKSDFKVTYDDGNVIVWDVKGQLTECFKLKWKLVKCKYSKVDFRCVKARDKAYRSWVELDI